MQQILVQPPQKMEVRIKILYTSICHTDLSGWKGESEPQRAFPRIFGHEASGIVESVGEGVKDLNENDKVVIVFNGECGECNYCKCEKTNMCEKYGVNPMKRLMCDGTSRFSTIDGKLIYHFLNSSTFTEYTVVDSGCALKLNTEDILSLKKLTLLSCGVSTGIGAAWNNANVHAGSSVAIFGLGAIGLAVALGAQARGASKIIGVDVNPEKLTIAKAMGITDFINPRDEEKPVVEGWGLTILLGIHASPKLLPLHPMELFDGRKIEGSVFGGFKGKSQLPNLATECMKGAIKLDDFITHELPFDEINKAFDLLIAGKSLRCLLTL
ncbi:putative alcohol dehydrogenase [Medicago truncatula]|uniref:alcohol dehydrogenase n=1 Tax=Medicago truncatula TaxID=3880 RepID=A0A396H662_MEDTR|nr:putative alcohol dehydrogenase [Medicago truncatula]